MENLGERKRRGKFVSDVAPGDEGLHGSYRPLASQSDHWMRERPSESSHSQAELSLARGTVTT